MSKEANQPLDTTALQQTYKGQELPEHEKFGQGLRFRFGSTLADVYNHPPERSPVVQLRMKEGYFALGDVLHVLPTEAGGLHVDSQFTACEVSKTGDVATLYTAPPPELAMSQNGVTRRVNGHELQQSTLDIAGTPEGVKLQIKGKVDAAPRFVDPKNQRSPLMFFLIEENPSEPDKPVYHEVWAINKPKQELKASKLTKGMVIEGIFFRHTYQVDLIGGGKETVTRHNLVKVMYVEKKAGSATRQKKEQEE